MNTCDTTVRVHSMPQCAKVHYRTRTCVTHFLKHHGYSRTHAEPYTSSLTLSFAFLKLHVLALTLAFLLSHSLTFCSSLFHIADHIKFNYYLIPLIIGRVTHPLAPLNSTSSSEFILIIFIIIDTASVSLGRHV